MSVLAASAAIAGLTACGSSGSVAPAIVPVAATQSAACAQIMRWTAAGGLSDVSALEGDLGMAQADAAAGDLAAVQGDGQAITADAITAIADPLPGSSGYVTAMTDIGVAGSDMTAGDFAGATARLSSATPLLDAVTASLPAAGSC